MSSTRSPANGSAVDPFVRARSGRRPYVGRPRQSSARRAEGPVGRPEAALRRAGRVGADSPRRPAGSRRTSPVRGSARTSWHWSRWRSVRWGSGRPTPGRARRRRCAAPIQPSIVGASAVRSRKSFGSSIHSGCSTMAQKSSHCCPVPHPSPTSPSLAAPTPGVGTNRLCASVVRVGRGTSPGST